MHLDQCLEDKANVVKGVIPDFRLILFLNGLKLILVQTIKIK